MNEWTNRCIYGYIKRYYSVIHIILSLYIVSCTHVMVSYTNMAVRVLLSCLLLLNRLQTEGREGDKGILCQNFM